MKSSLHPTNNPWNSLRWKGITRPYTPADVDRLHGTVRIDHTLARTGADKFWKLLRSEKLVPALGAVNATQVVEMVQAGLQAVYLSECPFAESSFRGAQNVATAVRNANGALLRADQIAHSRRQESIDWMLPIVADGDGEYAIANSFESMKAMIEAGAAAVHFDDQLPATRRCGQLGGKTLIPTEDAIQKLIAARLAADTMDVPTVIIARTDADGASYISNDHDERDQRFLTGERTGTGQYVYRGGMQAAIARALAYAPHADLLWCETTDLNKEDARKFAEGIHAQYPGKMLAYNCSPSFYWRAKMNEEDIACFQRDLAAMGYNFQFISLAGYHTLNLSMYQFAKDYAQTGMAAYSRIQQLEREMAKQLGHEDVTPRVSLNSGYDAVLTNAIEPGRTRENGHVLTSHPNDDLLDYNGDEATERTPMPQLYPSLQPAQVPMASAAD
jgi:isocitrate lyase